MHLVGFYCKNISRCTVLCYTHTHTHIYIHIYIYTYIYIAIYIYIYIGLRVSIPFCLWSNWPIFVTFDVKVIPFGPPQTRVSFFLLSEVCNNNPISTHVRGMWERHRRQSRGYEMTNDNRSLSGGVFVEVSTEWWLHEICV